MPSQRKHMALRSTSRTTIKVYGQAPLHRSIETVAPSDAQGVSGKLGRPGIDLKTPRSVPFLATLKLELTDWGGRPFLPKRLGVGDEASPSARSVEYRDVNHESVPSHVSDKEDAEATHYCQIPRDRYGRKIRCCAPVRVFQGEGFPRSVRKQILREDPRWRR